MIQGRIVKALSGFYYVETGEGILSCKARGRFRLDGTSPLVGDTVECSRERDGSGRIDRICERKNWFVRPAIANIDALVFVAANANPVTDPFLIDRVSVIAEESSCELILCLNKMDLDPARDLLEIFSSVGYPVVRTSAETGEGIDELRRLIKGKTSTFTGNSGVGKSSLLNRLLPEANAETQEVSDKLGRGKHTTRHVELFALDDDSFIADTPGFASFELEMMKPIPKERLASDFIEFGSCLGECRFQDCAHIREPGCAVRQAVEDGRIPDSRYRSYLRLYDMSSRLNSWEIK